jgi:glutamate N-acetyltransferase / amino-acid N-acetyltransferase
MTNGPGINRIPLPLGFRSSGINCGVRKYRPDIGILFSDRDCVAAGVFTTNECKAAPVLYSQKILPSAKIRGIVTNSGQANAATGAEGVIRNKKMVEAAAKALGCKPNQVLAASTGVIGHQIDIEKITEAMPLLVDRSSETAEPFALAILTTDLVPKTVTTTVKLSQGEVRITGISKGSGMIHPNMATMLGYLATDCEIPENLARSLLQEANSVSFNMISVDGDTSTNDCVFLLANGASGVGFANDDDYAVFRKSLIDVAQVLAKAIARDGEGADKLIEVNIRQAPTKKVAVRAARGITVSPLIKAAIQGADPNWGRILARLGAEQVPAKCLDKMTLKIQGAVLFEKGAPASFIRDEVKTLLKTDTVVIDVDLHSGEEEATAWGCDLTKRYVDINTEYN